MWTFVIGDYRLHFDNHAGTNFARARIMANERGVKAITLEKDGEERGTWGASHGFSLPCSRIEAEELEMTIQEIL